MAVWAAGILAVLAAAAFTLVQFLGRATIAAAEPGPGDAVATTRPTLTVTVENASRLDALRVLIDGRPLQGTARGSGDTLVIHPGALREGTHVAEVSFRTRNIFARTVRRRWTFDVDVTRPALRLRTPAPRSVTNRHMVRLAGRAEPGAAIRATWRGGTATGTALADGSFTVRGRFAEGADVARVTATDRAGNSTAVLRRVLVDTTAPRLEVASLGDAPLTETDEPLFRGTIPNDSPARLVFAATVNGRALPKMPGPALTGFAQAETAAAAPTGSLRVDGHAFELGVGQLAQGDNRVVLSVRDPAGNIAKKVLRVRVDSTEEFGTSPLVRGARGADVVALQQRLKDAKLYRGTPTGRYDTKTYRAVRRYQRRHGFTATGTVGPRTLTAMVGRIVIDLSQYKLRLIRDGKVVVTYGIAIGQPAYPTPTGTYEVVNKQKNPTWIP
ncbi:MAG: peptidoglycan-binding protein, partial [Actinomycetota bacterium]